MITIRGTCGRDAKNIRCCLVRYAAPFALALSVIYHRKGAGPQNSSDDTIEVSALWRFRLEKKIRVPILYQTAVFHFIVIKNTRPFQTNKDMFSLAKMKYFGKLSVLRFP